MATRELYLRTDEKVQEAGFAAGSYGPEIWVVDPARPPVKPAAPNLLLYSAVTLFISLWLALGGALLMESWKSSDAVRIAVVLLILAAGFAAHAQGPTPNTSGLPSGVARIPQSTETKSAPNAKDAPAVWGQCWSECRGSGGWRRNRGLDSCSGKARSGRRS